MPSRVRSSLRLPVSPSRSSTSGTGCPPGQPRTACSDSGTSARKPSFWQPGSHSGPDAPGSRADGQPSCRDCLACRDCPSCRSCRSCPSCLPICQEPHSPIGQSYSNAPDPSGVCLQELARRMQSRRVRAPAPLPSWLAVSLACLPLPQEPPTGGCTNTTRLNAQCPIRLTAMPCPLEGFIRGAATKSIRGAGSLGDLVQSLPPIPPATVDRQVNPQGTRRLILFSLLVARGGSKDGFAPTRPQLRVAVDRRGRIPVRSLAAHGHIAGDARQDLRATPAGCARPCPNGA